MGAPEIAKHKQGERPGVGAGRGGLQTAVGWDPNTPGRASAETRKIFVGGLSQTTKESALSVRGAPMNRRAYMAPI